VHRSAILLLVLSVSTPVLADVFTNTYCSVTFGGTTNTQTGPSSCTAAAGPAFAQNSAGASISGTQSFPVAGSPNTAVGSSFTIDATTSGQNFTPSDANAFGDSTLELTTSGPVRSGYLAFSEQTEIDGVSATSTFDISIGSLSQTCTQYVPGNALCNGDFGIPVGVGSGLVPFVLGQTFVFEQTVSVDAPNGASIPHYGIGTETFSFTLLEADGSTPVQLYAVPEPGSLTLAGCGLVAASLLLFRKKN